MVQLWETHHLIIIILVLCLALIAVGSGRGLSPLIKAILKRLSGEKVEVNIIEGNEAMAEKQQRETVLCDPTKCTPMQIVILQQQRNVADIRTLGIEVHGLTDLFFKKLNFIKEQNAVILRAMVKNNQLSESDIPKEVG